MKEEQASNPWDESFLHHILESVASGVYENVGVTLFVAGGVVTGILIPRLQYVNERNQTILAHSNKRNEPYEPITQDDLKPLRDEYAFCYMKNAHTFSGTITLELGLWCGRISEVAGFSIGILVKEDRELLPGITELES